MPQGMKQQDMFQNRGRRGWKSYSGGADRLPERTVYVLTAAQTTGKPGTKCSFCQSIKKSHLSLSPKPHHPTARLSAPPLHMTVPLRPYTLPSGMSLYSSKFPNFFSLRSPRDTGVTPRSSIL